MVRGLLSLTLDKPPARSCDPRLGPADPVYIPARARLPPIQPPARKSFYPALCPTTGPPARLSLGRSVARSLGLSDLPSVHPSVSRLVCRPVCLSVCLSIRPAGRASVDRKKRDEDPREPLVLIVY